MCSNPAGNTCKIESDWELLERFPRDGGFDSWLDNFTIFTVSMYKWFFDKQNMEFGKSYPSTDTWVSILHIQIWKLHMRVVPGSASQDVVIKCVCALLGFQCVQYVWLPIWCLPTCNMFVYLSYVRLPLRYLPTFILSVGAGFACLSSSTCCKVH